MTHIQQYTDPNLSTLRPIGSLFSSSSFRLGQHEAAAGNQRAACQGPRGTCICIIQTNFESHSSLHYTELCNATHILQNTLAQNLGFSSSPLKLASLPFFHLSIICTIPRSPASSPSSIHPPTHPTSSESNLQSPMSMTKTRYACVT